MSVIHLAVIPKKTISTGATPDCCRGCAAAERWTADGDNAHHPLAAGPITPLELALLALLRSYIAQGQIRDTAGP